MHSVCSQFAASPALFLQPVQRFLCAHMLQSLAGAAQSRAAGSPGVPCFGVNWMLLRHFAFPAVPTLPWSSSGGLRPHRPVPGHRPAHGGLCARLRHLRRGALSRRASHSRRSRHFSSGSRLWRQQWARPCAWAGERRRSGQCAAGLQALVPSGLHQVGGWLWGRVVAACCDKFEPMQVALHTHYVLVNRSALLALPRLHACHAHCSSPQGLVHHWEKGHLPNVLGKGAVKLPCGLGYQ